MAQEEILELLRRRGEMTAKELQEELDTTQPAMSKTLKRLLKSGEVERRMMPDEERSNMNPHIGRIFLWKIAE